VRFLFQITALVLLALWLPTTQHCEFDSLLDWESDPCESVCDHGAGATHDDLCVLVEGGNYTASATRDMAPAPTLTVVACFACLHALALHRAPPLPPPAWTKDDPGGWIPQWAFATRASLPARAPNLI
jgi:hypothetical protein